MSLTCQNIVLTKNAINYAEVLFGMNFSDDVIKKSSELFMCKELTEALESPSVSLDEKFAVIDRLFDESISGFVKTVCKNDETDVLKLLPYAYKKVWNKYNFVLDGTLEYSEEISDLDIENLKVMLMKKYNVKKVELEVVKQPDVIGGFRLYIGDKVYDKSVAGTLERMRSKLVRR